MDSPLSIAAATAFAVLTAIAIASFLFASYGVSPLHAYFALFHEPFATLRGFGYALVRTAPLTLIALGTIVSWRSGFGYLGFEGCFVIGAAAASWLSLATAPGATLRPASPPRSSSPLSFCSVLSPALSGPASWALFALVSVVTKSSFRS